MPIVPATLGLVTAYVALSLIALRISGNVRDS